MVHTFSATILPLACQVVTNIQNIHHVHTIYQPKDDELGVQFYKWKALGEKV
jgi:hypothetical protein